MLVMGLPITARAEIASAWDNSGDSFSTASFDGYDATPVSTAVSVAWFLPPPMLHGLQRAAFIPAMLRQDIGPQRFGTPGGINNGFDEALKSIADSLPGSGSISTEVDVAGPVPETFPLRRAMLATLIVRPIPRLRGGLLTQGELAKLIDGAPLLPGESLKGMPLAGLLANALKAPGHIAWSSR